MPTSRGGSGWWTGAMTLYYVSDKVMNIVVPMRQARHLYRLKAELLTPKSCACAVGLRLLPMNCHMDP